MRDAAAAQLPGDLLGQRDVARDLIFGHFKDETGPLLGLRPILGDERGDRHPQQHADRHVDGEVQIEARVVEHRPVAQRREQRMLRELGDAVFVDVGQETAGQQYPKLRMVNARQRLRAGKAFAPEIDLRLVPDLEPIVAQRVGDRDARPLIDGHGGNKGAALVLSHLFDRPRPVAHVIGIGFAHAHKTATGVISVYAGRS